MATLINVNKRITDLETEYKNATKGKVNVAHLQLVSRNLAFMRNLNSHITMMSGFKQVYKHGGLYFLRRVVAGWSEPRIYWYLVSSVGIPNLLDENLDGELVR